MSSPTRIDTHTPATSSLASRIAWIGSVFGETSRKSIWAIADQAVVSGTSFATTIIVGRYAGLDELGIYALGFGILVLMITFQQSLILSPFSLFSNRMSAERKKSYAGCVLQQQALFMCICVILFGILGISLTVLAPESVMDRIFYTLSIAIPLFSLREFCRRFLLADLNTQRTLTLDFTASTIQIISLFLLFYYDCLSAITAYMAMALACGIPSLIFLLTHRDSFLFSKKRMIPFLKRHWSFGKWICASQLTYVGQAYSIHWLIALLISIPATGFYSTYASVLMIFNPIVMAITGILLPRASQVHHQGGKKELRRVVGKGTIALVIIVTTLSIPVALFGDQVIHAVYDIDSSFDSTGLIYLLLGIAVFGNLSVASENGICVLEKPYINFLCGISGTFISLITSIIFSYWWGVQGVALGALIGVVVVTVLQIIAFLYYSNLDDRIGEAA